MGRSRKKKSLDAQKKEEEEFEKFKKTVEAVYSKIDTKQAQGYFPTNQQKPGKKYGVNYNYIIQIVMEYKEYDPKKIIKRCSRQGVFGEALFRCKKCRKGWKSAFGWAVIDLKRQKVAKFFKQGCLRCMPKLQYNAGPFFTVIVFIGMVLKALLQYEYYIQRKQPNEPDGSDDGEEHEPNDDSTLQIDDGPHKKEWCERCVYKRGKCWIHGKQCIVDEREKREIESILEHDDEKYVPVGLNKDDDDDARKRGKGRKLANVQAEGDAVAPSRNVHEP
ncbi:unnamed protein product [Owenia fusiformis]|uniref:3CxxC-type domain-containing protein n=1 Tax=Owenia fusiformis TaxID=6347 RepID=A0A8S4NC53_OWEFU|nr:unnamed protein product [Owenia fusiformis]